MGRRRCGRRTGSTAAGPAFAVSVVPALLAGSGLLVAGKAGLALLIAGFAGLLGYDLWTIRRGYAPGWYAALRWQLTTAVVMLLWLALWRGVSGCEDS